MIPEIALGSIRIPSYFLVISLSLSFLVVYLSMRVDQFSKDRKIAFDIALLMMVAGFFGGRLMHIFYEEPDYYANSPIEALYFWNGGFVFLGGMISCLIFGWLFCLAKKINFKEWADFFTPIFSLSHALGRIGCVLAGCCFGIRCSLPWAMDGRHPTALYLVLGELIIFGYLIFAEKRNPPRGSLFVRWILLHSILRFIVEYYRGDDRGEFLALPLLGNISISQMICLVFIVTSLGYFIVTSESLKKLYNRQLS